MPLVIMVPIVYTKLKKSIYPPIIIFSFSPYLYKVSHYIFRLYAQIIEALHSPSWGLIQNLYLLSLQVLKLGQNQNPPEKRTIVSTNLFKANEAISIPIFISIPFCLISKNTSESDKSSIFVLPFSNSFTLEERICQL